MEEKKKTRSDLWLRTLVGILFVGITVAAMLVSKYLFLAYILLVGCCLQNEFYALTVGEKLKGEQRLALLTGLLFTTLVFLTQSSGLPVRFLTLVPILILILMASPIFLKDKADFAAFPALLGGLVYVSLPMGLAPLFVLKNGVFQGLPLLCLLIIIWCSDIGAYCFGMLLGQKENSRKLCPELSPKKSWIGFWGGMFTCVLAALILSWTGLLALNPILAAALGIVMHVFGVCGDLFESLIKRTAGVKDSSHAIPGHGGWLDRFDSLLFAIPAGAIFLSLLP